MIAAVLLVLMTVVAAALLWAWRFNLPTTGIQVEYVAQGDQSEPAWGDPTDCSTTGGVTTCDNLPAMFVIFTSHSPANIPLVNLKVTFVCNGTVLLNGTFKQLEVVPGTGANPGNGSPLIQNCGTWQWGTGHGFSATYFNRLLYYQQVSTNAPVLKDGDVLVIYIHPFGGFKDRTGHPAPDDDYHGVPLWCFTKPGSCIVYLSYTGAPASLIASIDLTQLHG